MNNPSSTPVPSQTPNVPPESPKPQDSYVKLAMRNMVRKKGISLKHFFLTTVGLLGFLVGISYLTR
ncbi:DUF3285 domain-containing protein [Gloeothece verrucosa]|uniref:DUF3285 domain-containing protein n=1 Tax=Gloeothece verrucosa (strain PCC 7822) TaxID=497965 RepID=E0UAD0_GLOV7|nr:DUF3285 domain-containing protein [Gloeothece verrucosa]ADN17435.1 conserved hypothetical protein [Gloeothece verrucosa PCC 7822]